MAKGVSTVGTTSQEVAKLRSKGFIAFEVDGVLGRITKPGKKRRSRGLEQRLVRMVKFTATYLAHIKARAMRGDLATNAAPYSSRVKRGRKGGAKRFVVPEDYAEQAGADKNWAPTSAQWHQSAGSVPGNTTGLMWRGVTATNNGNRNAVIRFNGSSIGSSSSPRYRTSTRGGRTTTTRSLGKKARNQHKAAVVFNTLGPNVIQPKASEEQAGADLFMAAIVQHVRAELDISRAMRQGTTGNRRLYMALTREMRKRAGRG